MGVKERRERDKENLRQEILDVAREMFTTEGYANISMRKIADKIEYSPTTIYLYFKDKNDLLFQICEETFGELSRKINEVKTGATNPLDGLRKSMKAYINYGLEFPKHYELLFITPIFAYLDEPSAEKEYKFEGSMGERTFNHLIEGVTQCMNAEYIKRNDVNLISQTLWSGMHGVVSLLVSHVGFPFVEREKLVDSVIETLIKGVQN